MPKPKSPQEWLAAFKDELVRRDAAIDAIDRSKLAIDKRARMLEVKWAGLYVRNRPKLIEVLDALGIYEKNWCSTLGRGFSYASVMRRIQLLKGHDRYLKRRDEVGDNGCFGLEYAAYLARPEKSEAETNSRPTRPQIVDETPAPDPGHQFLTGKAHTELRKMPPRSVQVCITSPPYYPGRRLYNVLADGSIPMPTPDDIGHEPTFEGYLDHVVRRDFRELKRVLRPDGVLVVVLDDVIANPASIYDEQTYHSNRSKLKSSSQVGFRSQDTTYLRPQGNWLGLPWLFAAAMMDDGWFWRDCVIWDKGPLGRKESTDSRCRHNFEWVLFFTLSASGYWYDQDLLRIPLAGGQPYSVTTGTTPGRHKRGILRRDGDRDFRIPSNPLGRVHDAVWHIPPSGGYGSHPAAFPEKLVRPALLLTGPPREMLPLATVIDLYGGSGTVSAVAKKMGLKSIYIDSNPIYTEEARQCVLAAERDPGDPGVANDNLPSAMRAGD
jgi:DNA modification methylase